MGVVLTAGGSGEKRTSRKRSLAEGERTKTVVMGEERVLAECHERTPFKAGFRLGTRRKKINEKGELLFHRRQKYADEGSSIYV